jgi:hypothetical protein
MVKENGGGLSEGGERRQRHRLRLVFDSAYEMVEPFFAPDSGWAGHSLTHLAYRVMRQNFAELSSEEVHSLVVSAHRAYIDRNPDGSDHLPRPSDLRQPVLFNRAAAV